MRAFQKWMLASVMLASLILASCRSVPIAEVNELEQLVPEAKGYEVIAKLNPTKFGRQGYQINRSGEITGDLTRIGYLLKLTDKSDKMTWVFVSMKPFSQDLHQVIVPSSVVPVTYVEDMEIFSNADNIKKGKVAKGNIEFWNSNYGAFNKAAIPGASNSKYDFGDAPANDGKPGYGSMQVHNFEAKETIFAFNSLRSGNSCDLGIGNKTGQIPSTREKGKMVDANPDWTFSKSGADYKDAELFIVGKFDNLKIVDKVVLDPKKCLIPGTADRERALYGSGEEMIFTLTPDFGGQTPTEKYFISWARTGDDGITQTGKAAADPAKPLVIKTNMKKSGFVRILAYLEDATGRRLSFKNDRGHNKNVVFDGGAGVDIDKLQGVPEPEDFDAFWNKQKAKLAAVPVKADMKKLPGSTPKVDIYAVTVDCAGPRPVTGYLTIPVGAKDKSLPAAVSFQGYGFHKPNPPKSGPENMITFAINAHGFELGRDDAYYDEFRKKISTGGKNYAMNTEENKDPETAYFNGMTLRVMRALQFVKSLPQWDGKKLIARGGSQGGLQALWAAGLDSDVTQADPSIPWCCDLGGRTLGRIKPSSGIEYVPALNYYDPINHAKRIKCPVNITRAGLGDYTCPPSGVAILYNNIKSPKKITWVQGSTHGYTPAKGQRFVLEQN